eukprot:TRINITY_DN33720_c0_g1_i1.p1 TRINITY_DN33720_c0_g1~~TRINITY_DN33720_c0_g1_i1.p1  ORF type:complete len:214 (+),score=30.61 TRINITY_DN33720_c0_g1_i1:50-691(+)
MSESDAKRCRTEASPLQAVYVTGNEGKHSEAQHIVSLLRGDKVTLTRINVDLPELQGEPEEISLAKTKEAVEQLRDNVPNARYIITDDSGLELACLNGFPGVYIKPTLQRLFDVGLADMVHRYDDHRATATCMLGIHDRDTGKTSVFYGDLQGQIVSKPRGDVKHGKVSWNTIFVPAGESKTFGEMPMVDHAKISHRRAAFKAWLDEVLPLAE